MNVFLNDISHTRVLIDYVNLDWVSVGFLRRWHILIGGDVNSFSCLFAVVVCSSCVFVHGRTVYCTFPATCFPLLFLPTPTLTQALPLQTYCGLQQEF